MRSTWAGTAGVALALGSASLDVSAGQTAPPQIPLVEWIQAQLGFIAALAGDSDGVVAARDVSGGVGAVAAGDRTAADASWSVAPLEPPDPATWALWGRGVARAEGQIAVGAPARLIGGAALGAVLMFERLGTTWSPAQEIDGEVAGALFGWSVALDASTLVIGSPGAVVDGSPFAGEVHVYALLGGRWIRGQVLTSDAPRQAEFFGGAIALEGDRMVVGGPGSDRAGPPESGAAWIFSRGADGVFALEALVTSPSAAAYDGAGSSVALGGDTVAMGSPGADIGASGAGAVVAATRVTSGRLGTWEIALLAAPSPLAGSGLGRGVVASPDRIVASRTAVGPAIAFARTGGRWQVEFETDLAGPLARRGPDVIGRVPHLTSQPDSTLGASPIDRDCDGDGVQDQLAVLAGLVVDCDGNLDPDSCQIEADPSRDLDGDGRLDDCPIARASVPVPSGGFQSTVGHFARIVLHGPDAIVQLVGIDLLGWPGGMTWPQKIRIVEEPPALLVEQITPWAGPSAWSATPFAIEANWLAHTVSGDGTGSNVVVLDRARDGTTALAATFLGSGAYDHFGRNMASTPDELLASTPWDSGEAYPVRRFLRGEDGSWSEAPPLLLDAAGPGMGIGLAREGALIAISDQLAGDDIWHPGSVRIGTLSPSGAWREEVALRAPIDGVPTGIFGAMPQLHGDRLFVGGAVDGGLRRLFIYRRLADGSWGREGSFAYPNPTAFVGRRSFTVRGTTVLVGAGTAGIERVRRAANGAWVAEPAILSSVVGWKLGSGAAWTDDGRMLATAIGPGGASGGGEVWLLDPIVDCNGNGVADRLEILAGSSADANGNGVPDECERPGDMNLDGIVDATDLAIFLGRYGLGPGLGDLDDDGAVGADDLALLLADWG